MQTTSNGVPHREPFWRYVMWGFVGAVLMTEISLAGGSPPFVIAHRGASGYVPEHTLAGYFIAIQQGADYVEPDLVISKDGALLARHENEIGGTTDVSARPEFASRKVTKTIDGETFTGWFTEDFTLAELKSLRARERLPDLRGANARYDGAFSIPTFDEVLDLVVAANAQRAELARAAGLPPPPRIGVYPETKHPSYFAKLGLFFDDRMLESLNRRGYSKRSDPICLQSFEVANLKALRRRTDLALVQLVAPTGQPFDFTLAGDKRTYLDLLADAGLGEIATYADAIGPHKWMVVQFGAEGARDTGLARRARAAGLGTHVWTLRAENEFLPVVLRSAGDAAAHGDLNGEIHALLDAGITGFFSDHPDLAVRARDEWWGRQ
ncbi:MAG TPA: glycerophosphodiester phosphodiesterase [Steroidobacteraceae bacterium]|nr:glycerophosphodiester phosphodiesterase [Steroidobacteraceae bacterium]